MARGGWRYGAGRPGWHVKAENCLQLDVREFARRKLLGGMSFGWHWTNTHTGERVGSIGVRSSPGRVCLDYSINGQPASETVELTTTACGFGGSRPWFRCPRCWGRVAVLYLRVGRFACRRCVGIAYSSQSEDAIGRSWRLQQRLERRLGDDWQRPKGMHHRTRELLLARIFACEEVRDHAIGAYLRRLGMPDL